LAQSQPSRSVRSSAPTARNRGSAKERQIANEMAAAAHLIARGIAWQPKARSDDAYQPWWLSPACAILTPGKRTLARSLSWVRWRRMTRTQVLGRSEPVTYFRAAPDLPRLRRRPAMTIRHIVSLSS